MMNDKKNPTELDTFLDGTTKDGALTPKFKVQVAPGRTSDLENGPLDEKPFDPFTERKVDKPTTDCDTLTHLLKAALGTGILAMPYAFKHAGLLVGVFATILAAFVCTHCAYILVKCAHVLYFKTKRTQMSFADVSEAALLHGPQWMRRFAHPSRYMIQISLFVTYYTTCSVYTVIIQTNLEKVLSIYVDLPSQRWQLLLLLVPIILICLVPNLKYLAPFSAVANVLMGLGLGITFYYICEGMEPLKEEHLTASITQFPVFFSITIFAMEAIGVIMPLENNMKTPQNFVGICGVLNKGMTGVAFIYTLLGFLGYARYGSGTLDTITLNLNTGKIPSQIVLVCIAVAVFCTLALQFYVCVDIAWSLIKDRYTKRPQLANSLLRVFLAIGAVAIAIVVPTIGPFLSLIGAFCFSILGLLIPVFIETVTFWDIGFGACHWVAFKNIAIVIIGMSALIFGTRSALIDISKMFYGS